MSAPATATDKRGCSSIADGLADLQSKFPNLFRERTPEEAEQERQAEQQRHAERQARDRAARVGEFLATVGRRYHDVTLDNYSIANATQNEVVETLRTYCRRGRENVADGRGIVLFGPAGTGKDHLLIALGKAAAASGFTVLWRSGMDLFSEMRDRIGQEGTEAAFIARYTTPQVLILSDPLPPTGSLTDFQAAILLQIVDRRYRELKPTWASLNVASGKEADARMGAQVVDRLKDGALVRHCNWASHRKPADTAAAAQGE
jgi:DNA replication protein DnaC